MTARQHRTAVSMLFIATAFIATLTFDRVYDVGLASAADAIVDTGSGSSSGSALGSATATPADQLHNPAQNPLGAIDDVKAAKKLGWGMALFAVLVMLTKALAYAKDRLSDTPLLGKLAAWLAIGRRPVIVAGIGTLAAAGYNVLATGGTLYGAIFATAIAGAALMHPGTPSK